MQDTFTSIFDGLQLALNYVVNPNKRIYYLYLLSSGVLAFFVYQQTQHKSSFVNYVFSKDVWWGDSPRVDYALVFFNGAVKTLFIAPIVVFGPVLQSMIVDFSYGNLGRASLHWDTTLIIVSYTLMISIVGDFSSFLVHYVMHKVPFLWEFHKIHHSATVMNPLTQYRIHPVELILNNIRRTLVYGLVTGIFFYLADGEIRTITFLGINLLTFVFYFWGANLRHSHVKLTYFNWLEKIFISPYQHQIHHSNNEKHYDKNMGAKLAVWDWLFGTLLCSKDVKELRFGLGKEDKKYRTFWMNLVRPFNNIFKRNK